MRDNLRTIKKTGVLLLSAALLFFAVIPLGKVEAANISKGGNWEYEIIKSNKTDTDKTEETGSENDKSEETTYDIRLTSYKGSSTKLTIPTTVDGHNVAELASYCFSCNTELTKVVIPACILKVPVNTFDSCTNLSEIHFKGSETVTSAKFASACSENLKVYCYKDSATYRSISENYDIESMDGSIELDKTKETIAPGDTLELKATTSSEKAKVTWSSDNEAVAAVSDKGVVTANTAGKAIISAKTTISGREYVATCKITVKKPSLSVKELTITRGFTGKIEVKNGKNSKKWTTSDKKVAIVDKNGTVKGVSVGSCVVKTEVGGVTLKCKITVRSNMYKAPYQYKVKEMPEDKIYVQVINAYFNGERFIVKCRVYNTTKTEYKGFSSLKLTGIKDDKELFAWEKKNVSAAVATNKAKNFTLKFNTKELYKYLDLNTISLKLSGTMEK